MFLLVLKNWMMRIADVLVAGPTLAYETAPALVRLDGRHQMYRTDQSEWTGVARQRRGDASLLALRRISYLPAEDECPACLADRQKSRTQ
jgi:hypothetical protein